MVINYYGIASAYRNTLVAHVDEDDYPDFSAASTYAVGDRVTKSGVKYVCITQILAPAAWNAAQRKAIDEIVKQKFNQQFLGGVQKADVFYPDLTLQDSITQNISIVSKEGLDIALYPEYNPLNTYNIADKAKVTDGTLVTYYVCNTNGTTGVFDAVNFDIVITSPYWDPMTSAIDDTVSYTVLIDAPLWKPYTQYGLGDLVIDSGILLEVAVAHTSGATIDPMNFIPVMPVNFIANDKVYYNNKYYLVETPFTYTGSVDVQNLIETSAEVTPIDYMNIKRFYKVQMRQRPLPENVDMAYATGSTLVTGLSNMDIVKKFVDYTWDELIKLQYHRVKVYTKDKGNLWTLTGSDLYFNI